MRYFDGMAESKVTLTARRMPGKYESVPIEAVTWSWIENAIQYRDFTYRRRQKHFSGLYWAATMGAHVAYESRLELGSAMLADFDPSVQFILSQPFQLSEPQGRTIRRHVPDYLLRYADDRVCVVDVKPRVQLSKPGVRSQFEWTRRILEARGWEYRVESEVDAVLLENIRFLAGYRRDFEFDHDHVHRGLSALTGEMSFGHAIRTLEPICGSAAVARGVVLRLLWKQGLVADLSVPLESTSAVAVVLDA